MWLLAWKNTFMRMETLYKDFRYHFRKAQAKTSL